MKTFTIYYLAVAIITIVIDTFATSVYWKKFLKENEIIKIEFDPLSPAEQILNVIKGIVTSLIPFIRIAVMFIALFCTDALYDAFENKIENAKEIVYKEQTFLFAPGHSSFSTNGGRKLYHIFPAKSSVLKKVF